MRSRGLVISDLWQQNLTKCRALLYNGNAVQPGRSEGAATDGGQSTKPHANFHRGEVVRMWKKNLLQLLRILVIAAVVIALLTTKAC